MKLEVIHRRIDKARLNKYNRLKNPKVPLTEGDIEIKNNALAKRHRKQEKNRLLITKMQEQ